ncbi:hypothetical protein D0466_17695 [Peribacillus glennii]|uniref:Uncharacterized protein n=1 Tax=Peribacillus glennii TaxID=2303991 RepID=A0A372L8F5_9BACI|nr:hypothetical protein D0466_17695 [Peribacillus glennii]
MWLYTRLILKKLKGFSVFPLMPHLVKGIYKIGAIRFNEKISVPMPPTWFKLHEAKKRRKCRFYLFLLLEFILECLIFLL